MVFCQLQIRVAIKEQFTRYQRDKSRECIVTVRPKALWTEDRHLTLELERSTI